MLFLYSFTRCESAANKNVRYDEDVVDIEFFVSFTFSSMIGRTLKCKHTQRLHNFFLFDDKWFFYTIFFVHKNRREKKSTS